MKLCDIYIGLPCNSEGEVSACNAVEPGSSPGLGRSSGELEKGMAIHTSILAWRISWSEDHSRLQSMGLQRVRHDWATKTTNYYYTLQRSFPGGSAVKNPSEMHEMWIWSLSWEDPGEGNDNPLLLEWVSCLGNLKDSGAWQPAVHGVTRVGHKLLTIPPPYIAKLSPR